MGVNFIAPNFWDSAKVAKLGCCGKTLLACMITGPQIGKVPGLYRGSAATFYKFMRPFSPAEVEDGFKRILESAIAIFDDTEELIRLPKVWKYHLPQNSNQILSWRRAWVDLPPIAMKFEHLESLRELAKRSDSGPRAFAAYFGGIKQGYPETYPFDRSWVPEVKGGNHSRKGSPNGTPNHTKDPTGKGSPEIDKDPISILGEEEREDPDLDQDPDPDPDPNSRFPQGSLNGTVNGLGNPSVKGIVANEKHHGEHVDEPRTGERERSGHRNGGHSRASRGNGAAPAVAPSQPGGIPEGTEGGGRGGEVVPLNVSPVERRRPKRQY